MSESMKNLFPGYFDESKVTKEEIWEKGTFVFDANIFLNLYRYSDTTREDFLKILRQISDRVWVPHHAVNEYLQSRLTEIKSQASSYDNTVKEMGKLESAFDNNKQHPFVSESTSNDLKALFKRIKNELEASKGIHTSRMKNDPIKDALAALFEGKVGLPYTDDELEAIFELGDLRYEQKTPPGYKDSQKERSRKFGDLIVWFQTLKLAKDSKTDVVFVTDDNKEDWWTIENGLTISPRPELIKEFKDDTDQKLLMYRAHTFVEEANKILGSTINPDTIEEIRQAHMDTDITSALEKYQALSDLVDYLNSLDLVAGADIPSERNLSSKTSHSRSAIREQLGRLESHGFIERSHGKATKLLKELPESPESTSQK